MLLDVLCMPNNCALILPSLFLSLFISLFLLIPQGWCYGVVLSTSVVNSCFGLLQLNVIFQFPAIEKGIFNKEMHITFLLVLPLTVITVLTPYYTVDFNITFILNETAMSHNHGISIHSVLLTCSCLLLLLKSV